jgi:hypothetical protein
VGTLFVDGRQVGEALLWRTVPFIFSVDGIDNGSPVSEGYESSALIYLNLNGSESG